MNLEISRKDICPCSQRHLGARLCVCVWGFIVFYFMKRSLADFPDSPTSFLFIVLRTCPKRNVPERYTGPSGRISVISRPRSLAFRAMPTPDVTARRGGGRWFVRSCGAGTGAVSSPGSSFPTPHAALWQSVQSLPPTCPEGWQKFFICWQFCSTNFSWIVDLLFCVCVCALRVCAYLHTCIYIYTHTCVCVCVCV